jgi:hypothetical protein
MNSKKIEQGDKEKLISAKVDYSIAKGTISSLNEYNLYDMKEIISDIFSENFKLSRHGDKVRCPVCLQCSLYLRFLCEHDR